MKWAFFLHFRTFRKQSVALVDGSLFARTLLHGDVRRIEYAVTFRPHRQLRARPLTAVNLLKGKAHVYSGLGLQRQSADIIVTVDGDKLLCCHGRLYLVFRQGIMPFSVKNEKLWCKDIKNLPNN